MFAVTALLMGFVCAAGGAGALSTALRPIDSAARAIPRVARPAGGEPARLAQVEDGDGAAVPGAGDDLGDSVGPDIKRGVGPDVEEGIGPDIKGGVGPDIKGDVGENVKDAIGADLKGAIGEDLPTPKEEEDDDSDD